MNTRLLITVALIIELWVIILGIRLYRDVKATNARLDDYSALQESHQKLLFSTVDTMELQMDFNQTVIDKFNDR